MLREAGSGIEQTLGQIEQTPAVFHCQTQISPVRHCAEGELPNRHEKRDIQQQTAVWMLMNRKAREFVANEC